MSDCCVFEVNEPRVVEEMIDGEVVAVNLETGAYYSLLDEGCNIWRLIKAGLTLDQISNSVLAECDATEDVIRQAVSNFINELSAEGLIRRGRSRESQFQTPDVNLSNGSKRKFVVPQLQKFTDMQELLLLDPVHEVAAAGWPHQNPLDDIA